MPTNPSGHYSGQSGLPTHNVLTVTTGGENTTYILPTFNGQNITFATDVSLNRHLNVLGEATMHRKLFLLSDLVVNGKAVINSDMSLNGRLYANKDIHLRKSLFISGALNQIGDAGFKNRLFVNGIIVATATNSTSLSSTLPLTIARQLSTSTNDYVGYIDDLRITKGYARYTTTFTPPDAPFPTS